MMQDCGNHYAVRLSNGKELLADKVDLQFIEAHIWFCDDHNYVNCKKNKACVKFHNLILGHSPTISLSVDHINRNPLDNRRFNLRIANTNYTRLVVNLTASINRLYFFINHPQISPTVI